MLKMILAFLAAAGLTWNAASTAAGYPERPVRLVAGSAAGGGTDFVGRATARKVSGALGQQFVIDNRGGAAGIVGSDLVAKADPDGYTLLVVFSNFSTYPSLGKKLTFDVQKDFQPISNIATTPLVLVVNNNVPAKSVKELIDLARQKSLNYAAPGVGSMGHLAAELFKIAAKVNMEHIAYKGGGPAITALIGNEVELYFSTPPSAVAQMKAGRLRALAVTGPKRAPFAPDLPTVAESGLPRYEVEGWFGVFAPARTPAPIVNILNKAFAEAVRQPDVQELFAREGVTGYGSSPEQLAKELKRDIDKWANVIRTAKITVE
jgi:tripartite-type tricarboxylate transporter receptor subunit TctC